MIEDAACVMVDAAYSVDKQQRFVCVRGTRPGCGHHRPVEAASRRENAGSIDEDDLCRTFDCDAKEAAPRRLCLWADDRQLAAHKAVEQRRLPRIRSADQRNVTAPRPRHLRLKPRAVLPTR